MLELSKVRRQVAVVQHAAAFLDAIIRTWRTPAVYSQVREKERGREEEEEEEEEEKKKRKKRGKRKRRKRKKVSFFLVWEQPGLGL